MKITIALLLVLLVAWPVSGHAQSDDEFYYRLGGGLPIGVGATNRANTLTLGGGVTWNADLTCGNFDISTSISNQLNGISGAFQDVMGNVINTATGVVASLPALAIQRLNPALYDLLQNGVLQASEEYRVAELQCKEIVATMEENVSSGGFEALAKQNAWRNASAAGGDIVQDVDTIEANGGDAGVEGPGGVMEGGAGQEPIRTVGSGVVAGINSLTGRAPDDVAPITATQCGGARVCQVWDTPAEAEGWITDVVGEVEIRTCTGCDKLESRAGMGMQNKYEAQMRQIQNLLTPMVNGTGPINETTLSSLQGGEGFQVSRRVIEAIREEKDRVSIVNRLSAELAMSRTLERALLARRVLLAGMKEPSIANNDLKLEHLGGALDQVEGDIETMMYELDVRAKLASNTTVALLRRQSIRNQGASVIEDRATEQFDEGAVRN